MSANAAALRFFVDETSLGVGKALAYLRTDTIHTGHPLIPTVPLGSTDDVWIPAVGTLGLVAIGRDRHIRTRPGELALMKKYGLRVFRLAGKRDLSNWDYMVRLVHRWGDIENIIATRGPGPWFMAVHDTKVTEVPLPP